VKRVVFLNLHLTPNDRVWFGQRTRGLRPASPSDLLTSVLSLNGCVHAGQWRRYAFLVLGKIVAQDGGEVLDKTYELSLPQASPFLQVWCKLLTTEPCNCLKALINACFCGRAFLASSRSDHFDDPRLLLGVITYSIRMHNYVSIFCEVIRTGKGLTHSVPKSADAV
jgi:hypothetical protein